MADSLTRVGALRLQRRCWTRALRTLNPLVNIALLAVAVATFATGVPALLVGPTEFPFHRYAALAMLVLLVVHLGLHWRSLAGQWRRISASMQIPGGETRDQQVGEVDRVVGLHASAADRDAQPQRSRSSG